MAPRTQSSVPGGRTDHVRPLPRLSRASGLNTHFVVTEKPLPVIPQNAAVREHQLAENTFVNPKLQNTKPVTSAAPAFAPATTSVSKPLKLNLPIDHFVDGISARPKPAMASDSTPKPVDRRVYPVRSLAPVPSRGLHESFIEKQITYSLKPKSNKTKRSARGLFARFAQVGNYGLASIVLLFFSWLAFDTWQTNTGIKEITGSGGSSQAQALAERYDESLPKGDPLKNYAVAPDLPRAIYIERLGVKSKVIRVGVTDTNAMDVPKSIYEVGWYDGSVKPGETGAVVMNGHVSGPTKDGVFHGLKQLKAGENIVIEKGDGTKLTYNVNRVKEVAVKDVDMTELLVADPGVKSLNLITCGGLFDKDALQFQSRVLVFANQI